MTVTLGRFVWPDYQTVPAPSGPAVAVGQVGIDQAGADVTLHLYQMSVDDVWDLASWAKVAEGTVQPFTVAGEASVSRWWVVEKVTIDSYSVKANGQVTLGLQLGAVRDGGRPVVESLIHGGARRRTFLGVPAANARPWHAVPSVASTWYSVANAAGTPSGTTIGTAFGPSIRRYTSTVANDFYQGATSQKPAVASYPLSPADAMNAGVRIEVQVGGVWRTVHGMELPAGLTPADVRVSNGMCRVTGGAAQTGSRYGVTHQVFDGTAWAATADVTAANGPPAYCTVRRNSVESCMVVFPAANGWQLSVLLRRGSYLPVMTQAVPTPTGLGVEVWGRTGTITAITNADIAPSGANTIVLAWVIGENQALSASDNISWGLQAPLTAVGSTASYTGGVLPPGVDPQTEIDLWHAQQSERVLVPR